jgi:hypothetical protein
MHRAFGAVVAAAVLGLTTAGHAEAGVVITIEQVGSDVVAQGSGSINLSGLTFDGSVLSGAAVTPVFGNITFGEAGPTSGDDYGPLTGPSSFGPGIGSISTSSSGDTFGVVNGIGNVRVPDGYISGAPLSGTDTFANSTFSSLGLTPGTYIYTLPNDTIMVEIGAVVPEPSTLALAGIGVLTLAGYTWRPRRVQT